MLGRDLNALDFIRMERFQGMNPSLAIFALCDFLFLLGSALTDSFIFTGRGTLATAIRKNFLTTLEPKCSIPRVLALQKH
jgi:hypothetical protein